MPEKKKQIKNLLAYSRFRHCCCFVFRLRFTKVPDSRISKILKSIFYFILREKSHFGVGQLFSILHSHYCIFHFQVQSG